MIPVNPAYKFVQNVATLYDKRKFPNTVDQNGNLFKNEEGSALEPIRQVKETNFE